MKIVRLCCLLTALVLVAMPARGATKSCDPLQLESPTFDSYGGWLGVESEATGRFRTEKIDGRWWVITPEGHGFWINGPTGVAIGSFDAEGNDEHRDAVMQKYGSEAAWLEHTDQRLGEMSINSVGGWTSAGLWQGRRPQAVNAGFYDSAPEVPGWPVGFTNKKLRDYFGDDWPAAVAQVAATSQAVQFCKNNPWCLGVYIDNEQPRSPSINSVGTHLDAYMTLPAGAPGKRALQDFLEERYAGDLAAFNAAWSQSLGSWDDLQGLDRLHDFPYADPITDDAYLQTENPARRGDRLAFDAFVGGRHAKVVHDVLRALDPQMLILGARELSVYMTEDLVRAIGPWVDVLSINNYPLEVEARMFFAGPAGGTRFGYLFQDNAYDDMTTVAELSGKPTMVTEFFWRVIRPEALAQGEQPGILAPPGLPTVLTRGQQADNYENYQSRMLADPSVVGSTWFQWVDQPIKGRGGVSQDNPLLPENQAIGIVDVNDDLNQPIADRMTQLNRRMYAVRCGAIPPPPPRPEDALGEVPALVAGSLWELADLLGI